MDNLPQYLKRCFRLVMFFAVGLMFGGVSVYAFAAFPATAPSSTVKRPNVPVVSLPSGTAANAYDATGGNYCTVYANSANVGNYFFISPVYPATCGVAGFSFTGNQRTTAPAVYVYSANGYNPPVAGYSCPNYVVGDSGLCTLTTAPYTCPANSTLSGSGASSTCTCSASYVEQGGACVVNNCPTSGSVFLSAANATPVSSGCFNGCNVFVKSADNGWYVPSTGQRIFAGTFEYTGQTCTANNLATNNTASQCAAGTCPGTVNGVSTCLPCSASNPLNSVTKAKETTTKTDGTSSTTDETTSTTNNGGSVSTTTTTTINNTNAAGVTTTETKQATDEKPTNEFCKENPNTPMCKTSSFGGTCAAFTCDGDAVQCAIAKDQHARNCALFDTATPLSTLGAAVASGADPSASTLPNPLNPSVVNLPSQFDQTDVMGGACISDTVFTVRGQSLSIPWSSLCSYLSIMGSVMVALSMLVGLRISLGGVA